MEDDFDNVAGVELFCEIRVEPAIQASRVAVEPQLIADKVEARPGGLIPAGFRDVE